MKNKYRIYFSTGVSHVIEGSTYELALQSDGRFNYFSRESIVKHTEGEKKYYFWSKKFTCWKSSPGE